MRNLRKIQEDEEELSDNMDIFVYGQMVDDFHSLNKDAIFTITTASLQEIDKRQQNDRNEINKLKM